jgi:hypothetical protein
MSLDDNMNAFDELVPIELCHDESVISISVNESRTAAANITPQEFNESVKLDEINVENIEIENEEIISIAQEETVIENFQEKNINSGPLVFSEDIVQPVLESQVDSVVSEIEKSNTQIAEESIPETNSFEQNKPYLKDEKSSQVLPSVVNSEIKKYVWSF